MPVPVDDVEAVGVCGDGAVTDVDGEPDVADHQTIAPEIAYECSTGVDRDHTSGDVGVEAEVGPQQEHGSTRPRPAASTSPGTAPERGRDDATHAGEQLGQSAAEGIAVSSSPLVRRSTTSQRP
jgi:hypothetical protein